MAQAAASAAAKAAQVLGDKGMQSEMAKEQAQEAAAAAVGAQHRLIYAAKYAMDAQTKMSTAQDLFSPPCTSSFLQADGTYGCDEQQTAPPPMPQGKLLQGSLEAKVAACAQRNQGVKAPVLRAPPRLCLTDPRPLPASLRLPTGPVG